jgi:hypothetical protein
MKTFTPSGKRIFLRRPIIEKIGAIYIPTNSQEAKISIWEVISAGDLARCTIGDLVSCGRYAPMIIQPSEVKLFGFTIDLDFARYEYAVLNDEDVLGYWMEMKEVANA